MPILVSNQDRRSPAQMARLFAILRDLDMDRDDLATLMEAESWGDDPQLLTPEAYETLTAEILPTFARAAAH
jgi:hypothetical protein